MSSFLFTEKIRRTQIHLVWFYVCITQSFYLGLLSSYWISHSNCHKPPPFLETGSAPLPQEMPQPLPLTLCVDKYRNKYGCKMHVCIYIYIHVCTCIYLYIPFLCPLRAPTSNKTSIAMSTPQAQISVSKHHSLQKGMNLFGEMADSRDGSSEEQDGPRTRHT